MWPSLSFLGRGRKEISLAFNCCIGEVLSREPKKGVFSEERE